MDQKLENLLKAFGCHLGTETELPDEVFGFVSLVLHENGGLLITPIVNIPAGDDLVKQFMAGICILAEMIQKLLDERTDIVFPGFSSGTFRKILFAWTPEGLVEVPVEEWKLLMSARYTA